MSSLRCIFSYTFLKQVKSSAFKIITGVLGVVILVSFVLSKVLNNSDDKITINIIDDANSYSNISELNKVVKHSKIKVLDNTMSDKDAKKFVNDKNDNVIVKVYKDSKENLHIKVFDNYIINDTDLKIIENYINNVSKYMLLDKLGIDDSEKEKIMNEAVCDVIQIDTSFEDSYLIGYVLLLFLVLSIMLYCSQVAGEITYTKTNRVMEVLLTSAKPKDIFVGITLAVGLAGLLQLGIIILVGAVGYLVIRPEMVIIDGLKLDFSVVTYDKVIVYVIFFILSYLLFAVLNAGIGSLVSKNEDIMVAVLPITLVSCAQMFTGLMIIAKPHSIVAKFFSYFPFTSAGTMVMRYFMGNASVVNVLISIAILIISVIVLTYFATIVFVNGVIYYGNLNLKSIFSLKGEK